jgi:hypothetical protein
MLPIKTFLPIPGQIQTEMTDYNEMNDKIFDIDMNVGDIVKNAMEPMSFHVFHGHRNSTIHHR